MDGWDDEPGARGDGGRRTELRTDGQDSRLKCGWGISPVSAQVLCTEYLPTESGNETEATKYWGGGGGFTHEDVSPFRWKRRVGGWLCFDPSFHLFPTVKLLCTGTTPIRTGSSKNYGHDGLMTVRSWARERRTIGRRRALSHTRKERSRPGLGRGVPTSPLHDQPNQTARLCRAAGNGLGEAVESRPAGRPHKTKRASRKHPPGYRRAKAAR